MNDPTRCRTTRTDGAACKAPAMTNGEGLCIWHSERLRDARLAASRKGGLRRTVELPSAEALTPAKTRELIASLSSAVVDGSLDPNTSRSVAYLLWVDRLLRDSEGLDARMAHLEGQIASVRIGKNVGQQTTGVGRPSTGSELQRKARERFATRSVEGE
jgi:hypothetical protein